MAMQPAWCRDAGSRAGLVHCPRSSKLSRFSVASASPLLREKRKRMSEQQELKQEQIDQLSINALRFLAVDAVEKAKSGHPGAPLGCAPIAYLLYHKIMKHDPSDPKWIDRDRFILSNGHASALLSGSLHLSGYNLPIEQLQQFPHCSSPPPPPPHTREAP